MRLTWKFTLTLAIGILAVLVVPATLRVRGKVSLFEADIRRDQHVLGRALAGAVARVANSADPAEALSLVEAANERESDVDIRWVWLDGERPDRLAATPAQLRPVTEGNEVALRLRDPRDGGDAIYTYIPLPLAGTRKAALEVRESLGRERRYVRDSILQAALVTASMLAVCGVLAAALGTFFVGRPIRLLVEKARRVGLGQLEGPLHLSQRDELAVLAHEMNAMCERLLEAKACVAKETAARIATIEQLRHADRLTTVGKLAAGVAHEMGTPLNVAAGRAQLIIDTSPADSDARANALIVVEQTKRMTAIIRQLLDFARRRSCPTASHDLRELARRTLVMLAPLADKQGIAITVDDGDRIAEAEVDATQIQQALTNLVVNAIHAMKSGGTVAIRFHHERVTPPREHGGGEGDFVCLCVSDEGAGIPAEVLAHVFEPFFTTKDVGEGTGLGLSITYGIVRDHGGWISVDSSMGRGSSFSIHLPVAARA